MPIYRVVTQKRSSLNAKFENRYYMDVADTDVLGTKIGLLYAAEQALFGSTVTIYNVHWKQMNAAPFGNVPVNLAGSVTAASPFKSFIVAKVFWSAANSYPYYKNYRVHWQASDLTGITWTLAKQTTLQDFADLMDTGLGSVLCTRTGGLLGSPTISVQYHNEQEENAWYDKA